MLVLSPKLKERIVLETSDGLIRLTFWQPEPGSSWRMGIEAPATVLISRERIEVKP